LAVHSGRLCETLSNALQNHWELGVLGSATRAGDRHSVALLSYCRSRWPQRRPEELVEEKLAFVMGWLAHNAADRRFKPIYRELEPEHYVRVSGGGENGAPSNIRILHDVIVYREVYGGGRWGRLPAGLLEDRLATMSGAGALDFHVTFAALGAVWQAHLLTAHPATFEGGFQAACARAHRRYQRFYVDTQRYAAQWADPDPEQMRRFIVEPNFYDPNDSLIALARALQRGERLPAISVEEAYRQAGRQSQYAQTLQMGLRYMFAADDYFRHKISEADLRSRFDLDKTHLQGGRIEP
jgi:hypothetical protein